MPEENKEKKQKKGWFLKARTRCRTIYWQNFLLTASVVMLTLALLGSAFFALTYSYAIDERSERCRARRASFRTWSHLTWKAARSQDCANWLILPPA